MQQVRVAGILAQAFEQRHLQAAQRVEVGDAQGERAGEAAVVAEQFAALQNIQQRLAAEQVFGLYHGEDGGGLLGRLAQAGVFFGQGDVGFGHHLLHVRQHGLKEGVVAGMLLQIFQTAFLPAKLGHGAAEAIPSGQHQAVLCP